jgi:acetyltransferase-like isoleucine patch superfamily enzyme
VIHPTVKIHDSVVIDCPDLHIGAGSVIHKGCELVGRLIVLGRDTILDQNTFIGGGSAHMDTSELIAGDFMMCGVGSHLNPGCGLYIGDEVGIGKLVRIFTHGAWLSEYQGFPCEFATTRIGDRVWIPDGMVCAGSLIGNDVVIAAGSVVMGEIPSGSFAAGVPAKVKTSHLYPNTPPDRRQILKNICTEVGEGYVISDDTICSGGAVFNVATRTIVGLATPHSHRMKHQLRRHGIRFRYQDEDGEWAPWQ